LNGRCVRASASTGVSPIGDSSSLHPISSRAVPGSVSQVSAGGHYPNCAA
jgi:hypothetical protein